MGSVTMPSASAKIPPPKIPPSSQDVVVGDDGFKPAGGSILIWVIGRFPNRPLNNLAADNKPAPT